jgi:hypothetical protein
MTFELSAVCVNGMRGFEGMVKNNMLSNNLMISYVNLKPVVNSSSMVNPYKSSVYGILNVFM